MTTEETATAPIPSADIPDGPRLHVVLVEPEIAANAGAIGRTCVAAGAMLWLVRPLGFHLDDRHRRRAGLDYWEHLSWRVVDGLDEVVAALGPDRLWSFSTKGRRSYTDVAYAQGDALLFGAESRGLPGHWVAASANADRLVRIPIRPEARSLNLANAAAIGLFEALRQVGSARALGRGAGSSLPPCGVGDQTVNAEVTGSATDGTIPASPRAETTQAVAGPPDHTSPTREQGL